MRTIPWLSKFIRRMSPDDFTRQVLPFLEAGLPSAVKRPLDAGYIARIMPLVKERARTLAEVPGLVDFFFSYELEYDAGLLIAKNMTRESTLEALAAVLPLLEEALAFEEEALESVLRPLASKLGLKTGQLFGVLRVAVTGRTAAPPLFQTMAVLGRDRCLGRIAAARDRLAAF